MKSKIIAVSWMMLVFAGITSAQSFNGSVSDSLLDLLSTKNKAMGSLAVMENGNTIYARAIGFAQLSPETTASNAKTKYRIGSISKMFTATLIFQLVDEGKISLSTTLNNYFPSVQNADKITIDQMLNHKSGIHNFTDDPDYEEWRCFPKTRSEIIDIIASYKPDFDPGSKMAYSNSNFVLLGYILEDICQKPYNAHLMSRICKRIGLEDTYLGGKTDIVKNECYSYRFDTSWTVVAESDMSIPQGAGAIVSTPSDLNKFITALFSGKLISTESLNKMKTMENGMGMGLQQFPYKDKTVFGHGGAIDGFNSLLCYFPEEKLAVCYISNGTVYSVNDIVLRTINNYFGQADKLPDFTLYAVDPKDLEQYAGTFSSTQIPIKISLFTKDGKLMGQGSGQPSFPLDASAKDVFKFDQAGIKITFNPDYQSFTLEQGGGKYTFTKEK